MRKSKYILWLLAVCFLLMFVGGLTACNSKPNNDSSSSNGSDEEILEAELNGFSVSPSLIVTPGTSVHIIDPLTTDEYGNVLSVSHNVIDKNGNTVKLDLDRFFAMDGTYVVTYEVTQTDGVKKTLTKTIYVMDENQGSEILFLEDRLDLTDYLPQIVPEGYETVCSVESVRLKGENVVVNAGIEDNVLSKESLGEGYYRVNITLQSEESSFNYYTLDVDFYNTEWQWNTSNDVGYAIAFDNWCVNTYDIVTETKDLGNGEKTWYKVQRAAYTQKGIVGESVRFTMLPLHSKQYYEIYRDMGCTISFDYNYCFTDKTSLTTQVSVGASNRVNGEPNTVHTVTLSLDEILDLWDKIMWSKSQREPGSQSEELSFIRFLEHQKEALTCYIGNFRVNSPKYNIDVGVPPVYHEGVTLIDAKDKTNYILSNLLTDEERQKLSKYDNNISWALKNSAEEIQLTDGTVEFSTLPLAEYNIYATTADENNLLLFSAIVDFYNSEQAPTWNTVSQKNLSYVEGWKEGTSNLASINTANFEVVQLTEEGHTGNYYKLGVPEDGKVNMHYNLLPVHSKEYYQAYENYLLTFEYRVPASQYYNAGFGTTMRNSTSEAIWQKAEVPVSTLLENWEYLVGEKATSAENGSMLFLTAVSNTEPLYIAYIGNVNLKLNVATIKHSEVIVDVKEKLNNSSFDLTNLMDATEKEQYDNWATLGNVTWTLTNKYSKAYEEKGVWYTTWETNANSNTYTAIEGVVDFASVPYTVYDVKATLLADGNTYDVFVCQVDFYNSEEAPVWNYVSEETLDYAWGWSGVSTTGLDTDKISVENLTEEGHTGKYFKMTTTDSATVGMAIHYNVGALHTKAYYEQYKDYALTFEYRIPSGQYYQCGFTSTIRNSTSGNLWNTAEISIEVLLNNWNLICGAWVNREADSMVFVSTLFKDTRVLYVGNLQLVKS